MCKYYSTVVEEIAPVHNTITAEDLDKDEQDAAQAETPSSLEDMQTTTEEIKSCYFSPF